MTVKLRRAATGPISRIVMIPASSDMRGRSANTRDVAATGFRAMSVTRRRKRKNPPATNQTQPSRGAMGRSMSGPSLR